MVDEGKRGFGKWDGMRWDVVEEGIERIGSYTEVQYPDQEIQGHECCGTIQAIRALLLMEVARSSRKAGT